MEKKRWKQRLENFGYALKQFTKFIEKKELNELEKQGLIKAFEYTYELAWNTLKDYYEYQGEANIQGSRDAIQIAIQRGLIIKGEVWMKIILSRNLTSHIYNEDKINEISDLIQTEYYFEINSLHNILKTL
jgi:nucleotidyltransferase substrate binding protein (TIGR01987 family)